MKPVHICSEKQYCNDHWYLPCRGIWGLNSHLQLSEQTDFHHSKILERHLVYILIHNTKRTWLYNHIFLYQSTLKLRVLYRFRGKQWLSWPIIILYGVHPIYDLNSTFLCIETLKLHLITAKVLQPLLDWLLVNLPHWPWSFQNVFHEIQVIHKFRKKNSLRSLKDIFWKKEVNSYMEITVRWT